MADKHLYMQRCLDIARNGLGYVAPNPMVGCVIVYQGNLIGEGFHLQYGKAHAEVNAIQHVKDKSLLSQATLYVNLEPCSHFGKTPPCTDLIVQHKIPTVVIGCEDISDKVSGKGILQLKKKGCKVITGVLKEESKALNKRFFTYHQKKRPYIILKWAQTTDGYIGKELNERKQKEKDVFISNETSGILVHKWRSEEQAIMIGTNTALCDNPQLNVRHWHGNNPIRIVLDRTLRLPYTLNVFDKKIPTLVFTEKGKSSEPKLEYISVDFNEGTLLPQVLKELYAREIQSVMVEGGTQLLNTFIENNLWDEARVLISRKIWGSGIKAPPLPSVNYTETDIDDDRIIIFKNT